MQNLLLAAALSGRNYFDELQKIGVFKDSKTLFSDKERVVMELVREYYEGDDCAKTVDKDILKSAIARKHPKHEDQLSSLVDSAVIESPINAIKEVRAIRRQRLSEDLAAALMVPDNDDKVKELITLYESLSESPTEAVGGTDIRVNRSVLDVVKKTDTESRIKLYPPELQEATGGALPGHHILIFARPDAGKSTFAINLAYGFLRQGLKTMYILNEDPLDDINLRMLARLSGRTTRQVLEDPEGTQEIVSKRNYDKLIFVDMCPGTPFEIAQAVAEYKPQVLLVDQSRNIEYSKLSRVESLEKVERFIRMLGKQHNMLTVSITQAGDSAEGRLVLGLGDVDSSNTGMQASADLMVGMGCNYDYEKAGKRMLSFPKNKLNGNKSPCEVLFDGASCTIGGRRRSGKRRRNNV